MVVVWSLKLVSSPFQCQFLCEVKFESRGVLRWVKSKGESVRTS